MSTRYDGDSAHGYRAAQPEVGQPIHADYPSSDRVEAPAGRVAQEPQSPHAHPGGHGRHGLMMLACCVPMIAIAVALVATGVAGSGALVGALLCLVMMAVMMSAMPGGHGHK